MKGKQILFGCLVITLLGLGSGCTQKSADTSVTNNGLPAAGSKVSQEAVMDSFNQLLKSNPSEKEVIKFIKDKMTTISKENVSTLVLGLEDLQKEKIKESYYPENGKPAVPILSDETQRQLQTEIKGPFAMDIIPNIKNTALKDILNDIIARGYKIKAAEGMYETVIDYEAYKQFGIFVTPDIKDYIDIKAEESNKPSKADAALIISVDEVSKRALATESFIKKYHNSKRAAEVKELYGIYVTDYLYGQNNTPAFDYQTKSLKKSFIDSYENVVLKNNESNLVKTIQEYLQVLKSNDFKRTDEVEKFLKGAINKLKN